MPRRIKPGLTLEVVRAVMQKHAAHLPINVNAIYEAARVKLPTLQKVSVYKAISIMMSNDEVIRSEPTMYKYMGYPEAVPSGIVVVPGLVQRTGNVQVEETHTHTQTTTVTRKVSMEIDLTRGEDILNRLLGVASELEVWAKGVAATGKALLEMRKRIASVLEESMDEDEE